MSVFYVWGSIILAFFFCWDYQHSYTDSYYLIVSSLIITFLYFYLQVYLFLRYGINRGVLFLLGISCIVVILFYASIYAIYGFICDGNPYLYALEPSKIIRFWNSVYFSIVTFTTLGYGDCKPMPELRLVCASEAVVGYTYLGLFVGYIMVYLTKRAKYQEKKQEENLMKALRKPGKLSRTFNRLFIPKELLERHKQELLGKQVKRHNRRFNVKNVKKQIEIQ